MRNTTLTELYLGETLGWVDVSADARQGVADSGGGHTITRVAGDPGTMDFVLASPDGRYSPRNPRSEYYGLLGRNTPVRFGLQLLADDFDRTVASGWGAGWTSFGAGGTVASTDTSVSGGSARHFVPAANAFRATYYQARSFRDCEVRVTVDMPIGDAVGGPIEPANILFRIQDINTYYMARVEVSAAEAVTVSLHHSTGVIAAAVTVAGLVFTGQPLEVAASCVGDRLAVKVWDPAAGGEPRDWQLTAVDTRLSEAGHVGVRSGVAAGNTNTKPVEFVYDNLRVIDRRAHMEVSAWPPRSNTAGTDTWVPVQAAGIMRRLGQGNKTGDSALYRAYATANPPPIAWWPLEDGRSVERSASGLPGQPPIVELGRAPGVTQVGSGDHDGLIVWGVEGSGGAASLAGLRNGGRLAGAVPASDATSWTFEFAIRYDAGSAAGFASFPMTLWSRGQWEWTFAFDPVAATIQVVAGTTSGSVSLSLSAPFQAWDGQLHLIRLDVERNGSGSDHFLWVDGKLVTSGTWAGFLAPVPDQVLPNSYVDTGDWAPSIAHLALFAPHAEYYDTVRPAAANGWDGELAADRVQRLCREQGVPGFVTRGSVDSAAMGPQRPAPFLDLLRECEAADGGILGEAREQLGITYRCLGSLYNQTPVTVDFTQLAPGLEPTDDDDHVRNNITMSRPGGGSVRAVKDTGPLSVQPPPDGVGTYDEQVTLNVRSDLQLPDHAYWRLHVGTWDEARYPRARVNLAAPEWEADPDLASRVTAVADGDVLALDGLPDWLPPGPALTMARGSVERVDEFERTIDWTLVPAGPYTVATVDGEQRVAADGSTLAASISDTDTVIALSNTAANGAWTTDPADYPLDVRVGGEQVRADAPGAVLTTNPWLLADGAGWTALAATISRVTDVVRPGTPYGSLRVVAAGGTSGGVNATSRVTVSPNGRYVATIWAYASSPVTVGPAVDWHDAGGAYLTTSIPTPVTIAAGLWTPVSAVVTAHASAASAAMRARHDPATPAGAVYYVTALTLAPEQTVIGVGAFQRLSSAAGRGVNGVQRAWPAGTEVDVWQPAVVAL